MKLLASVFVFAYLLSHVLGDIDENSPLYLDMVKILSEGKVEKASCSKEPNNQAPWIFHTEQFEELNRNENGTWFKTYNIDESSLPTLNRLRNIFPRPQEFEMPSDTLRGRFPQITEKKECADFDHCSKNQILQDVVRYTDAFEGRKIAMFRDVWVDSRGLIVHRQTCKAVRNGACKPAENRFELSRLGHNSYRVVISLATSWKGTWHWPMENIISLAHIDKKVLDMAVFHIPVRTAYIQSWLTTLGVPAERIVEGTVTCQVLLIPRMQCGQTFFSGLEWMRETFLPQETAAQRAAVGFPYSANSSVHVPSSSKPLEISVDGPLTLLLIERTAANRGVINMQAVRGLAAGFVQEHKMNFLVHTDHNLPPLTTQMRQFAEADIVLAPHGAGLMFSAFLPYTSCVIEFSHPHNPFCYSHIALSRNLSYIMVDMRNDFMNPGEAKSGLNRCLRAVLASKKERVGGMTNLGVDAVKTGESDAGASSGGGSTLLEGIAKIVESDSVVKDVLNTLSNFVP